MNSTPLIIFIAITFFQFKILPQEGIIPNVSISEVQTLSQPSIKQSEQRNFAADSVDSYSQVISSSNTEPIVQEETISNSQAVQNNVADINLAEQQHMPQVVAPEMVSSIIGGEILKIKDNSELDNKDEEPNIYLNFDNASLMSVINYLAEQKKINVIPHKDLANVTVTLSTRTPLTLNRAFNILLTLLEMNGFSMVKVGNLYRIVSNKENKFEPLPIYSSASGVEPENLPDNETTVRFVYFFKTIKVEMVRDILGSMLDREGILISTDLNACIIKDTCLKIKSAMKILKELDQGGLSEQVRMIKLHHASADVLEKLFNEQIFQASSGQPGVVRFGETGKKERTYFSSTTRILAEPTQNALFLLGTQKSLDRISDFIYKYLDVPLGDADSRLHIKEIKYAKAEDLVPILTDIIKPPRGQGSEKSIMVGEYKFFEDVAIVAEKASTGDQQSMRAGGNRLIVACTRDDWKRLDKIINKLDKPQPQVAFEIMIIAVDTNEQKQLGSQMYGFFGRQPGMGINDVEFSNLSSAVTDETASKAIKAVKDSVKNKVANKAADTPTVQHYIKLADKDFEGQGHPSFITLGRAATPNNPGNENIWSIIKMVFNVNNSHIIAQPFLVTNNNQPCCEDITTSIRVAGGLASGKGEPSKQTLVDWSAKTRIELTPHMNLDGVVDLDIQVEVSDFDTSDPSVQKKANKFLKTRSTLLSGEVLVLGGLTQHKNVDDEEKTPILGDIPIIGSIFFRNKNKTVQDQNLYIFIRPSLMKPKVEGEADEYTQLKVDYAKYQLLKNDTYLKEKDPIQRWFFKPPDQSIKQKFMDGKHGIIRPLDNFVTSKYMPRMVNIKEDSYFKVSEELVKHETFKEKPKSVDVIQTAQTLVKAN